MKKSIIAAGAASVALAAMPIVGLASAADFTDQLNLSIANNCAFTRQTTAHGSGENWSPSGTTNDVLTGTQISLGTETTLGTSNFKVVCNNEKGYSVTVSASALTNTTSGSSATIPYGATATAGYWSLTSDGTGASYADNYVAYEQVPTNDESFTVTYKAYPSTSQAAGSYQGTAEYTFAQLQ